MQQACHPLATREIRENRGLSSLPQPPLFPFVAIETQVVWQPRHTPTCGTLELGADNQSQLKTDIRQRTTDQRFPLAGFRLSVFYFQLPVIREATDPGGRRYSEACPRLSGLSELPGRPVSDSRSR